MFVLGLQMKLVRLWVNPTNLYINTYYFNWIRNIKNPSVGTIISKCLGKICYLLCVKLWDVRKRGNNVFKYADNVLSNCAIKYTGNLK